MSYVSTYEKTGQWSGLGGPIAAIVRAAGREPRNVTLWVVGPGAACARMLSVFAAGMTPIRPNAPLVARPDGTATIGHSLVPGHYVALIQVCFPGGTGMREVPFDVSIGHGSIGVNLWLSAFDSPVSSGIPVAPASSAPSVLGLGDATTAESIGSTVRYVAFLGVLGLGLYLWHKRMQKRTANKRRNGRRRNAVSLRTRVGTRVRFNPNAASYMLYSKQGLPAKGELGTVTTVSLSRGRSSFMPGPGGGLVYVDWDQAGFMGVSSHDLDKASVR